MIIGEEAMLLLMLKKYLNDNRLNDAENILFERIENGKTIQKMQMALWFYKELGDLDYSTLRRGGFSQQEVDGGLAEIKKIFENELILLANE